MNEWMFALGGAAAGLTFGYAYGLRESGRIFANLNSRGMEELGKSITTITHLRELLSAMRPCRCSGVPTAGDESPK